METHRKRRHANGARKSLALRKTAEIETTPAKAAVPASRLFKMLPKFNLETCHEVLPLRSPHLEMPTPTKAWRKQLGPLLCFS